MKKSQTKLIKRFTSNAAHKMANDILPDAKNKEISVCAANTRPKLFLDVSFQENRCGNTVHRLTWKLLKGFVSGKCVECVRSPVLKSNTVR